MKFVPQYAAQPFFSDLPQRGMAWLVGRGARLLSSATVALVLVTGCGGGAGNDPTSAEPLATSSDAATAQQVSDSGERRVAEAAEATTVDTDAATAASSTITVNAKATLFDNVGPNMQVRVNGTVVASVEVRAATYQNYSFPVSAISAGSKVDIVFTNDAYVAPKDRNLYVSSITVNGVTVASTASGVTYDKGAGSAAFDGKNVVAGTPNMMSNGALRFVAPAAVPTPPETMTIASFSPTSGQAGTPVVISGTNLASVTGVAFNGVAAQTVSGVSAKSLTAVVPAGASTGVISVVNKSATVKSTASFTVTGAVDAPIILNASPTARPGDYVSIQGANFGGAPVLWLDSSDGTSTQLPILNKIGAGWVSAQVPTSAHGGLSVRVQNGSLYSAAAKLNAARPYHLDALQIVPGGAVRIFGRNLQLSGSTASVTFDGLAGSVDVGASNEHMLVVTAPNGLAATKASAILVDNGNGTGATRLDRTVEVVTSASGDPFGLGVGWAASLSKAASNVVDARSDSRLGAHVACNGITDDTSALQAAVSLAQSLGGGIVKLPSGTCRMANGVGLQSGVVIQGAGKTATTILYYSSNPIYAGSIDSAGIADMTIANSGVATDSILLHDSTRVFVKNVKFSLGVSHQIFLTNNKNMVITGSDFVQTGGSLGDQGPYVIGGSRGFVFTNNTTSIITGSSSFDKTTDGYIANNHFTRQGAFQALPGVMHVFTMNFAARLAVIGNVFDVSNGPIVNVRNDGETLLTEGGGSARTENLGTVQSATASTLTDNANTINTDPLGTGSLPENYGVAIVGGKGMGQTRRIVGYSGKTLSVDTPWDIVPDTTSRYATMVWGMEKSLIKGNTLTQNPRGIYLYQTGIREVDIIGNTMTENGGIYLRSYQLVSAKQFMPIYNVKLSQNKVANSNRLFPANITVVFDNADGKAFGTPNIGVDLQDNQITASVPNVNSTLYDFAGSDGFTSRMNVEANYYETTTNPRVLGTLLQRNSCTNCDVAFKLGTGSNGTMLMSNTLVNTKTWWVNDRTTISSEVATDTKTK